MFTLFGPTARSGSPAACGFDVFLDLKFHDIPNTPRPGGRRSGELGVWMVTFNTASGGARIDGRSADALAPFVEMRRYHYRDRVSDQYGAAICDLGVTLATGGTCGRLARLTQQCGLDGVVCSAREAVRFKRAFGAAFKLVTPGIRPQAAEQATSDAL